jgi:MoaA/NifB/PqqE/SkfB family radical SAM enzyme
MKKFSCPENYTPRGLVFIPTYNCTAMCRHCNNDFSKHDLTMKMDIEKAIALLYESKKIGLNSIQFTGGELTMYPEFMVKVFPHARKLTIRVNKPPTNCWLGKDEKALREFFDALKKTGYTAGFRLSIDPYHQERIPLESVIAFAATYGDYWKFSSLTIGSSYYDRAKIFPLYERFMQGLKERGIKDVTIEKEKKGIFVNGQKIKYGIWCPTRPSWKTLDDIEVEHKELHDTMKCLGPQGVGYLWVEPDFKVRVCSCNGNGFLDFYIIGDLKKESLQDVISRASQNKIFKVLANYGSAGLRDIVNMDGVVLPKDKKYTFMCELCNEILGTPELKKKLDDNINKINL